MSSSNKKLIKKRSSVWKHFIPVDPSVSTSGATCTICNTVLGTFNGGTSGLLRHFRAHQKRDGNQVEVEDNLPITVEEINDNRHGNKSEEGEGGTETGTEAKAEVGDNKGLNKSQGLRKRSKVWKYFEWADAHNKIAKCTICSAKFRAKGGTTSLIRHLEHKHGIGSWKSRRHDYDYNQPSQERRRMRDDNKTDGIISAKRRLNPIKRHLARKSPSFAWKYFVRVGSGSELPQSSQLGRCKLCKATFKIIHGGTTQLLKHLKMVHHISKDKDNDNYDGSKDDKRSVNEMAIIKEEQNGMNPKARKPATIKMTLRKRPSTSRTNIDEADDYDYDDDDGGNEYNSRDFVDDEEIQVKIDPDSSLASDKRERLPQPLIIIKTKTIRQDNDHNNESSNNHFNHHTQSAKKLSCCFACKSKFVQKLGYHANLEEYRFFLTEILEIPTSTSNTYLKELNNMPDKWIPLCEPCQTTITQSVLTRSKIAKLQIEQEERQKKMLQSFKTQLGIWKPDTNELVELPTKQRLVLEGMRKFVETKNYSVLQFEEDDLPDVNDGNVNNDDQEDQNEYDNANDAGIQTEKEPEVDLIYINEVDEVQSLPSVEDLQDPDYEIDGEDADAEERNERGDDDDNDQFNSNRITATSTAIFSSSKSSHQLTLIQRRNRLKKLLLRNNNRKKNGHGPLSKFNETEYRYDCPNCPNVKNYTMLKYALHLTIHQKRPFQCTICSQFLPNDEDIQEQHWLQHHSNIDLSTLSSTEKFCRIKFCAGKIYKCDFCHEGFFTQDDRDEHELICFPPNLLKLRESLSLNERKPHECLHCPSSRLRFRSISEWRFHRAIFHPEVDFLACYYCNLSFEEKTVEGLEIRNDYKLQSHLISEHGLKIHLASCEPCGISFDRINDERKHLIEKHGLSESKSKKDFYSCKICPKSYGSPHYLRRHVCNVHLQNEFHICDLCGEKFLHEKSLIHHKFARHEVKPEDLEILRCSEKGCGFEGIFQHKLDVHLKVKHGIGGEGPFSCKFCDKKFKCRGNLRGHLEIHQNGESKPYQCEICGKAYAVKNYLVVHKRMRHEEGKDREVKKRKRFAKNKVV